MQTIILTIIHQEGGNGIQRTNHVCVSGIDCSHVFLKLFFNSTKNISKNELKNSKENKFPLDFRV